MSEFNLEDVPSQNGRIAIVTGANVGLGYETAIGLASKEIAECFEEADMVHVGLLFIGKKSA